MRVSECVYANFVYFLFLANFGCCRIFAASKELAETKLFVNCVAHTHTRTQAHHSFRELFHEQTTANAEEQKIQKNNVHNPIYAANTSTTEEPSTLNRSRRRGYTTATTTTVKTQQKRVGWRMFVAAAAAAAADAAASHT